MANGRLRSPETRGLKADRLHLEQGVAEAPSARITLPSRRIEMTTHQTEPKRTEMSVPRGPVPDPAMVDWEAAYRALVEACMTVPIKQHSRTPEEQAAVERYTTRLVQAGELLAGPELGMMDLPLEDGCSATEFLKPGVRGVE